MAHDSLSSLEDEHQIANLLMRWGHARDSDDWEVLPDVFTMTRRSTSRYRGPVKDYIDRSRSMAAARKPGTHTKHLISGPWIRINQNLAFSLCHVTLHVRATIAGHEFDLQSWMRFFDLLEKRHHVWRLMKRTAVYEKDRLDPVDPRSVPSDLLADMDLRSFPAAAKILCYLQARSGNSPSGDIISAYSDREHSLREEGEMWIKASIR